MKGNGAKGPLEQPLAAPPASTATTKPPTIVANALGSPGHQLDPTTVFVEAWQSFSPPQLDANIAVEARW